MVQVWSNGKYKAALHRVVAMEKADRYSIPFFFNPSYETVVSPLENNDEKNIYQSIHWGDFRRKRADGDYANIGKEVQIADYLTQSYLPVIFSHSALVTVHLRGTLWYLAVSISIYTG